MPHKETRHNAECGGDPWALATMPSGDGERECRCHVIQAVRRFRTHVLAKGSQMAWPVASCGGAVEAAARAALAAAEVVELPSYILRPAPPTA